MRGWEGLVVAKRQAAGDWEPEAETTAAPGFRERPPRSDLDRRRGPGLVSRA